jgi:hypothetical protein
VGIFLFITLAIGVAGRQPHRYYVHVLAATGALVTLSIAVAAVSSALESPSWVWLMFPAYGLVWAIPIVIVARGYDRAPLYRLIPGKRAHER